jgi:hypothetical protein
MEPWEAPSLYPITPNPDTDGIIQLKWTRVRGATQYYVYRNTSPILSVDGLSPINITTNTNCTDNIMINGIYYYVVVAKYYEAFGTISDYHEIFVELLEAPLLYPIIPNPDTDGIVFLNWSSVPNAIQYYVYRNTSPILSVDGLIPINITTNTNYTDKIPTNGIYYYVVLAKSNEVFGSISNDESVTIEIPPPIPGFTFIGILSILFLAVIYFRRKYN